MDKRKFEKLVKPYILHEPLNADIKVKASVNLGLILQDFELRQTMNSYILTENELVFIPTYNWRMREGEMIGPGTFVFSDNSKMHCWTSGEIYEGWYETHHSSDWSSEHNWIMKNRPISAMNDGRGWNSGVPNKSYYVLDISKKFMNWVLRDPLNLK